jgi:hypothetical protein
MGRGVTFKRYEFMRSKSPRRADERLPIAAPSENKYARESVSPSAAKPKPIKSRATSAPEGSPVHAVITKIDRMKTRGSGPAIWH